MNACVLPSKSLVTGSMSLANEAIENNVPVVSMKSTKKKMNKASTILPPAQSKSNLPAVMSIGSTLTTFLK